MKIRSEITSIFLCIIITLALLTACSVSKVDDPIYNLPNTGFETHNDSAQPNDKETETDRENIPESSATYDWVVDPTDIEGDIQPIYDVINGRLYPCHASLVMKHDGEAMIGFDGEVKTDLVSEDYSYCGVCDTVTNHLYSVDIYNDYEITERVIGHGGGVYEPYIYDKDTGELFSQMRSEFIPAENVERAIVSVCFKRSLTEDEMASGMYEADYTYENSDGYGILINGSLVLSGYDMYVPYSCGVTAFRSGEKWGYFDTEGKEILSCDYDSAYVTRIDLEGNDTTIPYHPTEGVIVLNKGGKWAFADIEGNMLTDFEFDEARPVYEHKAWVKTADGWGVIELPYDYTEDKDLTKADYKSCCGYIC